MATSLVFEPYVSNVFFTINYEPGCPDSTSAFAGTCHHAEGIQGELLVEDFRNGIVHGLVMAEDQELLFLVQQVLHILLHSFGLHLSRNRKD